MRVFLSWSKEQSRRVARVLREWLPKVLPAVDLWMSEVDTEKGTPWWEGIDDALVSASNIIVCLTKENLHSPYLYYEAGAIAGKFGRKRIYPLLLEMGSASISDGPFGQLQATFDTEEQWQLLLQSLNSGLATPFTESEWNARFVAHWPELRSKLDEIAGMSISPIALAIAVTTRAEELIGYPLSSDAREILVEACSDEMGKVFMNSSMRSVTIRTHRKSFAESADARRIAELKSAIEELERYNLIQAITYKREVFNVSGEGYKVAEVLKRSK